MLPEIFRAKLAEINPSTVLTGVGVTGVLVTSYLTGTASVKAMRDIDAVEKMHDDHRKANGPDDENSPMTNKEKVALVWTHYIPAISVGATTITAIVMANHTASKKIAALTVASGISERAFQEYKAKVVEKIGETKETKIRDEVAQDRVTNNPPRNDVLVIADGDVLCFDMYTGRYFQSTVEKIRQAENRMNYLILNHVYASLSQFYDLIDIPPTQYSDEVGWNGLSDRFEIKFSAVMSPDQRPCIAIEFARPPLPEYTNLY